MSRFSKGLKSSVAALIGFGLIASAMPALTAAASPAVSGMTTQNASAADAFPGYRDFLNLPAAQRNQVNVYYALRIKKCDASLARASLNDNGRVIPLRIAADGRITPLPTREQLNSGATLTTSRPDECTVGMKIHPFSTQPNSRDYDAAGLATGIKQGNSVLGKIAGPLAALVPKLDRVYFVGGGEGKVEFGNGSSQPLPRTEQKGEYPAGTPYFVPAQMPGAARIHLSNMPGIAHFDTPPK